MVRSVTTKAKNAITDVAQRGVENVRSVAIDAGAAAKSAADVVLESTSNALDARMDEGQAGHTGDEAGDRSGTAAQEKGREEESGQEENGLPAKNEASGAAISEKSVDLDRKRDRGGRNELLLGETSKAAAGVDQFVERTLFDDFAHIENENTGCLSHR